MKARSRPGVDGRPSQAMKAEPAASATIPVGPKSEAASWAGEPRYASAMYSMIVAEGGYVVFAKGFGTPGVDEWEDFMTFFRPHASRARGWLAVSLEGAINSVQRGTTVSILQAAGCRFAMISPSAEAEGSVTAVKWQLRAGNGADAAAFELDEIAQALSFIDASDKAAILLPRLRRCVRDLDVALSDRLFAGLP